MLKGLSFLAREYEKQLKLLQSSQKVLEASSFNRGRRSYRGISMEAYTPIMYIHELPPTSIYLRELSPASGYFHSYIQSYLDVHELFPDIVKKVPKFNVCLQYHAPWLWFGLGKL